MSRLTDLRAALDELDAADAELDKPLPADWAASNTRQIRVAAVYDRLLGLANADTISALVSVAEGMERTVRHEASCPLCCPSGDELHEPDCPLFQLVKEADDE